MKLYGRQKGAQEDSDPIELEELTFQASPDDLKDISAFISKAAKLMQQHGNAFGHEHFKDTFDKREDDPEIVVVRL